MYQGIQYSAYGAKEYNNALSKDVPATISVPGSDYVTTAELNVFFLVFSCSTARNFDGLKVPMLKADSYVFCFCFFDSFQPTVNVLRPQSHGVGRALLGMS